MAELTVHEMKRMFVKRWFHWLSVFFQYYRWNNKKPAKRFKSRLKHKRDSFRCFHRLVHWVSCENLNKLIGPLNLQWCVQFGHNPFPSAKIDRVSYFRHRPECYSMRQLKSALYKEPCYCINPSDCCLRKSFTKIKCKPETKVRKGKIYSWQFFSVR